MYRNFSKNIFYVLINVYNVTIKNIMMADPFI